MKKLIFLDHFWKYIKINYEFLKSKPVKENHLQKIIVYRENTHYYLLLRGSQLLYGTQIFQSFLSLVFLYDTPEFIWLKWLDPALSKESLSLKLLLLLHVSNFLCSILVLWCKWETPASLLSTFTGLLLCKWLSISTLELVQESPPPPRTELPTI